MSRLFAWALFLLSVLTAVAVSSATVEISRERELLTKIDGLLAKVDELQRENSQRSR
jgi:hypothetical protein